MTGKGCLPLPMGRAGKRRRDWPPAIGGRSVKRVDGCIGANATSVGSGAATAIVRVAAAHARRYKRKEWAACAQKGSDETIKKARSHRCAPGVDDRWCGQLAMDGASACTVIDRKRRTEAHLLRCAGDGRCRQSPQSRPSDSCQRRARALNSSAAVPRPAPVQTDSLRAW